MKRRLMTWWRFLVSWPVRRGQARRAAREQWTRGGWGRF